MALSFVLAASAAAPAVAAPTTLDQSFGTGGFAFTAFGSNMRAEYSPTHVTAGGIISTATVTNPVEVPSRGLVPGQGVRIVQRNATGQEIDHDTIAFDDPTASAFDVRKLDDGRVFAVGVGGEWTRPWLAIVNADGTARKILEYDDHPSGCWGIRDMVIHQSGQVVIAWNCDEGTTIRVLDEDDFQDPTAGRGTVQEEPEQVDYLDEYVQDLAVAPDRTVAVLVATDERDRGVYRPSGKVARMKIGEGSWSLDTAFGDDGWAEVIGNRRVTVDAKNRFVTAGWSCCGSESPFWVTRVTPEGAPDDSFGAEGTATFANPDLYGIDALGTDDKNRPLLGVEYEVDDEEQEQVERGKRGDEGYAFVRLTEAGALDPEFDEDGIWIFGDEGEWPYTMSDPVAAEGGAIGTFTFTTRYFVRDAIPAPAGQASFGLVRFTEPKPPVTQQPQPQPQPQATQVATSTTASSTAPKTARMCLSRRSFTIRLRPRSLRTATVKVAGKKVKVTRKDGRLTAKVDLRKLKQATFKVTVSGRTVKGKSVRETRTYRTCRVGENGPKVKGGSITITLGA